MPVWLLNSLVWAAPVLALVLSILSLFLHYRQHKWNQRVFELQREEQVIAQVTYNPAMPGEPWSLQVYVVNTGLKPVYIRAVALGIWQANSGQEVVVYQRNGKENPVQPGDERYFSVSANDHKSLPHLSAVPRESVRLTVNTPEKTILTVPGSKFGWVRSDYDDQLAAAAPATGSDRNEGRH